MGAGAPDIAEIVSEVRERMPDLRSPPELDAGTAFRFSIYHIMEVEALASLFPVHVEDV